MEDRIERARLMGQLISTLSDSQFDLIEQIIQQLSQGFIDARRNPLSTIMTPCMFETLGDSLQIHHCFSKEPLSKDRFEYAFERAGNMCGFHAIFADKGHPGHDLTMNGERFSLKTEAAKHIKNDFIHISKFMELGKGQWDLAALREQFVRHMESYERILVLRCLSKQPSPWSYELVEIPKSLLLEATTGELRFQEQSRQNPKPGHCYVRDPGGILKYQLYFDGGTERKLQIQHIQKSLCITHAYWIFQVDRISDSNSALNG